MFNKADLSQFYNIVPAALIKSHLHSYLKSRTPYFLTFQTILLIFVN
jgi:hypothetical protein